MHWEKKVIFSISKSQNIAQLFLIFCGDTVIIPSSISTKIVSVLLAESALWLIKVKLKLASILSPFRRKNSYKWINLSYDCGILLVKEVCNNKVKEISSLKGILQIRRLQSRFSLQHNNASNPEPFAKILRLLACFAMADCLLIC